MRHVALNVTQSVLDNMSRSILVLMIVGFKKRVGGDVSPGCNGMAHRHLSVLRKPPVIELTPVLLLWRYCINAQLPCMVMSVLGAAYGDSRLFYLAAQLGARASSSQSAAKMAVLPVFL